MDQRPEQMLKWTETMWSQQNFAKVHGPDLWSSSYASLVGPQGGGPVCSCRPRPNKQGTSAGSDTCPSEPTGAALLSDQNISLHYSGSAAFLPWTLLVLTCADHRAAGGHVLTRLTSSLVLDKSNLYDDHLFCFRLPSCLTSLTHCLLPW